MMKSISPCILVLAVIAMPTTALAQPIIQAACPGDRLDGTAARQRIEWARRCALLTNTGGPSSSFSSIKAFDNQDFFGAREYREIDLDHTYSGSRFNYDVNFSHAYCYYGSWAAFTVFQETSGPTVGFWKWLAPSQRSRPFYPSFGTSLDSDSSIQLFPHPTLEDCNLYQSDPATGALSPWTGNFYVIAYCEA